MNSLQYTNSQCTNNNFEIKNETDIIYKGAYKHKKDCDCGAVNPIIEWIGGSNLIITGYECPKCHIITKLMRY
jgi:hypothetical protein